MMEVFSPYIIAAVVGWVVAQGLKAIIQSIKGRNINNLRQLYLSGGMPSAHSATVLAVTTVIGFKDGFGSAVFGLAFLVVLIVTYDAMMVRRSSGEQGASLTALIKEQKSKVRLPRVAKGHTPFEVLAGVVVGVLVGIAVSFLTI
ncbi:MAG: divergent PAP2 family protein [Candidatus Microsaccharimonas sp.]|jgi:acid phosphatase family membrane protein YuiD